MFTERDIQILRSSLALKYTKTKERHRKYLERAKIAKFKAEKEYYTEMAREREIDIKDIEAAYKKTYLLIPDNESLEKITTNK